MPFVTTVSIGRITTFRTNARHLNLEDCLREKADNFSSSEKILLHDVRMEGNPVYRVGDGQKEVKATIEYSPLEEISTDVYRLDGPVHTVTAHYIIDSSEGRLFNQYVLKLISCDSATAG